MTHRRWLSLVMLAAALGCGARPGAAPAAAAESDVITAAEIKAAQVYNAEEAVRRLRPRFLGTRGPTTLRGAPGETRVYLNDTEYGNVSSLRTIEASVIREIRFLNSRDAQARFGSANNGSVILVLTRG